MTPFDTDISCDLLVVGSGVAGMAATARAAELGLKVVRCGNPSQFYFMSGILDLLGAYPLDQGFLETPKAGWEQLVAAEPDHPYARASWDALTQSLDTLINFLERAGLHYVGQGDSNMLIPTALGTVRPGYRVPVTMANGAKLMENGTGGRLLLVDFAGLKGFSAAQMASGLVPLAPKRFSLACAGLHNSDWQISCKRISLPGSEHGLDPLDLAARFENREFVAGLIRELAPEAKGADMIGLPAVCGLDHCQEILAEMEDALKVPLFEIPMMPPSIPGIRLKNAFEKALAAMDIPFIGGAKIQVPESGRWHEEGRFHLEAHAPSLVTRIAAKGVILASGSFVGGGLVGERTGVRETILGLPVSQPQSREDWHGTSFFDSQGHGINLAGIRTDTVFSPVDGNGERIQDHLYAAGGILAHNNWTRLKSGAGTACLSAITAVEDFHGRGGSHA